MTAQPLAVLTDRVCLLEGALAAIANRCDDLLGRDRDWSAEYLKTVLHEIGRQALATLGEEGQG